MARRRQQRGRAAAWEDDYARLKEEACRVAEARLQELGHPYDRVQFVCPRDGRDGYDALVYVWHENGAQVMYVRLPRDEEGAGDEGSSEGRSDPALPEQRG